MASRLFNLEFFFFLNAAFQNPVSCFFRIYNIEMLTQKIILPATQRPPMTKSHGRLLELPLDNIST